MDGSTSVNIPIPRIFGVKLQKNCQTFCYSHRELSQGSQWSLKSSAIYHRVDADYLIEFPNTGYRHYSVIQQDIDAHGAEGYDRDHKKPVAI